MSQVYGAGALYIQYITDWGEDEYEVAEEDLIWQDPSKTEMEHYDLEDSALPKSDAYQDFDQDFYFLCKLFESVDKSQETK